MSTNSIIAAKCKDGKFRSIYCHWDGDISANGKTLLEHFQDQDKIEKMMSLGYVSILYPSIECPDGHSYNNPIPGYTIFYGRDRGEDNMNCHVFDTKEECINERIEEYNYFWNGQEWFVSRQVENNEDELYYEEKLLSNIFPNLAPKKDDTDSIVVNVVVTDELQDKVDTVLLSLISDEKMFTAYDVTKLVRVDHPGMNVPHNDVKKMVLKVYNTTFSNEYDRTLIKLMTGQESFVYCLNTQNPCDYFLAGKKALSILSDCNLTVENRLNISKEYLSQLGLTAGKLVNVEKSNGLLVLTSTTIPSSSTLVVNSDGRVRLGKETLTEAFGDTYNKYEISLSTKGSKIFVSPQ